MGRLIDADLLRDEVYSWGMNDYEPSDFTDAIDDAPTVEAIPKADYENRLKADMIAMLTDMQLEIEEMKMQSRTEKEIWNNAIGVCSDFIQQKIDVLKAESEG